jgi:hypothetical protein
MAVQASASQVVDGYTIIASYNPRVDRIDYVINRPDGTELLSAGSSAGVTSGLTTLALRAENAGNTELANTLRSLNAQLSGVIPQLNADIKNQLDTVQPPPPAEPVPPATENKTNPNDLNGTPAGDDSQNNKIEAARLASTQGGGNNEMETLNESFAGKTQAGEANVPEITITAARPKKGAKPGKRLQNPLGNFSSYTYQLSLYMITPDAYNAFVESGRKNINALSSKDIKGNATEGGAFLIAQSGGVNNKTNVRPPEFDVDFYIDDLKIKSLVSTNSTQSATNIQYMSFNIYEPYGFSFVTKLKRARESIIQYSKIRNYEEAVNASKQFFILGIRFQGYDKDGNIANASQYFSEDTLNTSSDASGAYERFYDITIESMKFKINGSATTYNIVAKNTGTNIGMGAAYGIIDNMIPIVAGNVKEALLGDGDGITSLIKTLNETQKSLESAGDITRANEYDIEFVGDTLLLQNASLISKADSDKKKQAMSNADKSSEVNEGTSLKSIPDKNKKLMQISKGTPIIQAINNIIKQSNYMESFLKQVVDSALEPNEDTDSTPVTTKKNPPPAKWYNITARLKCLEYDPIVNDFAYKITYVIQPYDTPAAFSPYIKSSPYPGPYKRYDYWFTGQNSEIISYEQKMDNAYFNVAINPDGDPSSHGGGTTTPTYPNKLQNQDRQGRLDQGMEAQNSYMTSLFDIGTYALATVTILGDPDYLAQETTTSLSRAYNQYYGDDGYSINPNGSQVFIEIDFKEAEDYNNKTGLMDVNDSIYFWKYPDAVANKIQGVSYQVRECESIFKSGKFTQVLTCNINDIPEALSEDNTQANRESPVTTANQNENYLLRNRGNRYANAPNANARDNLLGRQTADVRTGSSQAGSGSTPSSGAGTSSSTGFAQDKPPATPAMSQLTQPTPKNIPIPLSTTTTENTRVGVANDDSVQTAGQTQSGIANSQSPDAGRETQNDTLTGSRPGEGA